MITTGLILLLISGLIEIHQPAFQNHMNHCFKEIVNNSKNFNLSSFIVTINIKDLCLIKLEAVYI